MGPSTQAGSNQAARTKYSIPLHLFPAQKAPQPATRACSTPCAARSSCCPCRSRATSVAAATSRVSFATCASRQGGARAVENSPSSGRAAASTGTAPARTAGLGCKRRQTAVRSNSPYRNSAWHSGFAPAYSLRRAAAAAPGRRRRRPVRPPTCRQRRAARVVCWCSHFAACIRRASSLFCASVGGCSRGSCVWGRCWSAAIADRTEQSASSDGSVLFDETEHPAARNICARRSRGAAMLAEA